MSENLKDVLETIKESILKDDESIDSFLIDKELWKELLDYITNLQSKYENQVHRYLNLEKLLNKEISKNIKLQKENETLKKLHNEELYRRIRAHQYIFKNMICDALYPASKVDGENIIKRLNGDDE